MTPNEAAAKIQSSFRGAVARSEVRKRRGGGGGGFRPFTAKPLVTNPFYDRALWMAERASAAFASSHAATPMLGRQVELLRLQQWVAAQVGLGPARKPGVPAGATKAPTNGIAHGPLLLFSKEGSGKTRLLIALIERLTFENPQLTVCSSFGSIGQGCADFSRVVLTKLTMTLMILHTRDAGTDPRRQRQIRHLAQAQLPVGYAALCALCHKMLQKVGNLDLLLPHASHALLRS